jgi:hypothetical protein
MKTITIEEDGWVYMNGQGLGDLGVDVEIIDKRKKDETVE